MSSNLELPVEIWLQILDWLDLSNGTRNVALPLLNLSLTSHAFHHLVVNWLWTGGRRDDISHLESKVSEAVWKVLASKTALSRFSKQLGNICELCNNRARHSSTGELFTGLRLCHACEAFSFPKMSIRKCRGEFYITDLGWRRLALSERKSIEAFFNPQQSLVKWDQISDLIASKYISVIPPYTQFENL